MKRVPLIELMSGIIDTRIPETEHFLPSKSTLASTIAPVGEEEEEEDYEKYEQIEKLEGTVSSERADAILEKSTLTGMAERYPLVRIPLDKKRE